MQLGVGADWDSIEDRREAVPFGIAARGVAIGVDVGALDDGLVVLPASPGARPGRSRRGSRRTRPRAPMPAAGRAGVGRRAAYVAGVSVVDSNGRPMLKAGGGRPRIVCTLELPEAVRVLERRRPRSRSRSRGATDRGLPPARRRLGRGAGRTSAGRCARGRIRRRRGRRCGVRRGLAHPGDRRVASDCQVFHGRRHLARVFRAIRGRRGFAFAPGDRGRRHAVERNPAKLHRGTDTRRARCGRARRAHGRGHAPVRPPCTAALTQVARCCSPRLTAPRRLTSRCPPGRFRSKVVAWEAVARRSVPSGYHPHP